MHVSREFVFANSPWNVLRCRNFLLDQKMCSGERVLEMIYVAKIFCCAQKRAPDAITFFSWKVSDIPKVRRTALSFLPKLLCMFLPAHQRTPALQPSGNSRHMTAGRHALSFKAAHIFTEKPAYRNILQEVCLYGFLCFATFMPRHLRLWIFHQKPIRIICLFTSALLYLFVSHPHKSLHGHI